MGSIASYTPLSLSPKEYHLPELVQYLYHVMYRPHRVTAVPPIVMNTAAFFLEQNPFIPYMTRDIMKRVSWLGEKQTLSSSLQH